MDKVFLQPELFVAVTPGMGRGVFTRSFIAAGTIVESSPVIVMSTAERKQLDLTRLHDYIFEWGEATSKEKKCCMALGYVPLYNHSYHSNCEYEMDIGEELIRIRTVRDVAPGEELFINYNGEWNDGRRVWFDAK